VKYGEGDWDLDLAPFSEKWYGSLDIIEYQLINKPSHDSQSSSS
jgi:hypothetical protein